MLDKSLNAILILVIIGASVVFACVFWLIYKADKEQTQVNERNAQTIHKLDSLKGEYERLEEINGNMNREIYRLTTQTDSLKTSLLIYEKRYSLPSYDDLLRKSRANTP
jgi:flagellar basal body-associated protein FliL